MSERKCVGRDRFNFVTRSGIKATIGKGDLILLDSEHRAKEEERTIHPGTYELERISNPGGFENFWLVLKGTTLGMCEGAWKDILPDFDGTLEIHG